MTRIRTVGILIFDAVEVLDACGPFEVFSVARIPNEHRDEYRLFQVYTVAESRQIITCRGGLRLEAHHDIHSHPPLDLILVPGGQGTRRERTNSVILEWLRKQNQTCEMTLSVCTGAFLLAEAGILKGLRATTHWNSIDWMRQHYRDVLMIDDQRFVDEGRVITSAGITAGIDMSLHVVQRLHGVQTARWTARRMEYKWEGETTSRG